MTSETPSTPPPQVRLFNTSLLWPLQLHPASEAGQAGRYWERFEAEAVDRWQRLDDEFTTDPTQFQERHYREFVSFLPYVQRFLYGEGRSSQRPSDDPPGDSPLHVFRRRDIARLRLILQEGDTPVDLDVVHLDLYFFHDLDIVLLNVELRGHDLPLAVVREILFRFGRAYPSGWDEAGHGLHNSHLAEWIDHSGKVVARSDAHQRDTYLHHVCLHRSPNISTHWAALLQPMVLADSDQPGPLRYRLIEYHRMPTMAYLALAEPASLCREDWVRIGLATLLHPDEPLPVNDPCVGEFEHRYCQDRFWTPGVPGATTRFMCTGNALTVVGDAASPAFIDTERGLLAQFRHQYFLVFLIAHLHHAALLAFSENLVDAVNDLDIRNDASVRRFRHRIRGNFEVFLRFTHRYWHHQLSERSHIQAIFRLCADRLGNDDLYDDVRSEIREMSHYLDSDAQRRQNNTVVRLTVITTLGLIATVTTGYFGMNIIAFGEGSVLARSTHGLLASLLFVILVMFAVARSKRLYEFLESLSDERLTFRAKAQALWRVVRRKDSS